VKDYIDSNDISEITVNQAVIACGESFGCDMKERKKEIKKLLLAAMGM
jgi:hypothetical protein